MHDDEPDAPGDADLRNAFAVLRRDDAEKVPRFADLLAAADAPQHRPVPLRRLLVAASLVAALIAGVSLWRQSPAPSPSAVSLADWTAPTDFLLRTPGYEVLETVPRLGQWPELASLGTADRRGPVPKRRSPSP